MTENILKKYIELIYDFQKSKQEKGQLIENPLDGCKIEANLVFTKKFSYNLNEEISECLRVIRKNFLPENVQSIYYFIYGKEAKREEIYIAFKEGLDICAVAELVSNKFKGLKINDSTQKRKIISYLGENLLTIMPGERRIIIHPTYINKKKTIYEVNPLSIELLDALIGLRKSIDTNIPELVLSLGNQQIMINTQNMHLKNQLIRKKSLESKILKANDSEIRTIFEEKFI